MIVDKSGVVVDIDTVLRCSGIDVDDSKGTCLVMQRRVFAHGRNVPIPVITDQSDTN